METEFAIVGKLMEYGVGFAVLGYGWWKADRRADEAQKVADHRADKLNDIMTKQVATNEQVTTAMAVQNTILDRIVVYMDRVDGRFH